MMRKRTDGGIALILALLVLIILVVVILQMTASSLHNRTVAENHLSDLQNTYGARAGYVRALLFLQADLEQAPEVDSLRERWTTPIEFDLGKSHVRVEITDSERYVNLSQLTNEKGEPNAVVVAQLKRLVKALRHTPDVADRIIDYVDADTRGEFEARAKNDRLFNLEELLRIDGLTPEIVYGGVIDGIEKKGIRSFLTIWPKPPPAPAAVPEGSTPVPAAPPPSGSAPGTVNLNTASSEVLQALSDEMTPSMADAIVAWRTLPGPDGRPQDFQKVEDLKRVQGMSDGIFASLAAQAAVKSQTFEIRARGKVNKVEKAWLYVVQRTGGGSGAPTDGAPPAGTPPPPSTGSVPAASGGGSGSHALIGLQALNDFLSVKPPEEERQ